MMKYHIVPFGCQMNRSDTERIRTVVEQLGYRPAAGEEDADLIGIVACSVRQKAIDKVYAKIRAWNQRKDRQHLVTFVTGCILEADRERFLKLFDLVFTPAEVDAFPAMLREYGVVTPAAASPDARQIDSFWRIAPHYDSSFEAFVPIQNGCDKFCTFCAVPYTRGREVSRRSDEILAEIEDLVQCGYQSITLLGQNVNSYGLDQASSREITFPELLRRIGELGNLAAARGRHFWTYFTSPHPRDMSDEVLDAMATYPCLARQIHLPLQSGDDKLLMRMNRNHTVEAYRRIVERIRRVLPEATLFTDIIVGFCGETEEQFEATRQAMEEFRYDMAYIARYSPRPGARSFRWDDDIPHEIKRQRFHQLSDVLQQTGLAARQNDLGRTVAVLVQGPTKHKGVMAGHTEGRIPVQFTGTNSSLIGRRVNVTITDVRPLSMAGQLAAASSALEVA